MTRRSLSSLAGCLLLANASHGVADNTGDQLVDDVLISSWNNCSFIQIRFNVPISYTGHTPSDEGLELQVEFEAIKTPPNEWKTVFERRVVQLPPQQVIPLVELVYEKDFDGRRKLIFSFARPMKFILGQGEDLHLMAISIAEYTAKPCSPP